MKALILDATQSVRYGDAPDPVAGPDEVIVRVKAAGICGVDRLAYAGQDDQRAVPVTLGHEVAGVVDPGPTAGAMAGRRVVVNPLISCGTCAFCKVGQTNICIHREFLSLPPRQGAMAEAIAIPRRNLISLPEDVSFAQASLIEPLSCGWHVARLARRAFPKGRTALVIGSGAIGLAAALSLRAQGVEDVKIAAKSDARAAFLQQVCGQTVVSCDVPDPSVFYDIVIDAVGSTASRKTASAVVRPGGTIAHIGLQDNAGGLDMKRLTLQEVTLIGTYTFSELDFEQTAAAAFEGRLGPLDWFETRPLSDGAQAFADLAKGAVAAPRVVLIP